MVVVHFPFLFPLLVYKLRIWASERGRVNDHHIFLKNKNRSDVPLFFRYCCLRSKYTGKRKKWTGEEGWHEMGVVVVIMEEDAWVTFQLTIMDWLAIRSVLRNASYPSNILPIPYRGNDETRIHFITNQTANCSTLWQAVRNLVEATITGNPLKEAWLPISSPLGCKEQKEDQMSTACRMTRVRSCNQITGRHKLWRHKLSSQACPWMKRPK